MNVHEPGELVMTNTNLYPICGLDVIEHDEPFVVIQQIAIKRPLRAPARDQAETIEYIVIYKSLVKKFTLFKEHHPLSRLDHFKSHEK